MIPAAFDYLAPTSVEEALSALAQHGDDAKIMAGGQSLLPVLCVLTNRIVSVTRLAAPSTVDSSGLSAQNSTVNILSNWPASRRQRSESGICSRPANP